VDLGRAGGRARSRRAATRPANVPLDALREPDLRNDLSRPSNLRVPRSPLLVEQPCVRIDQLDASRSPHEQPVDVPAGDRHCTRLLRATAGRRPPLPGCAIGRSVLVLHCADLDPTLRGCLSCAEAPLTAKPSTRVKREDVLLWLFALTPVAA